jgi:hypothetical protein
MKKIILIIALFISGISTALAQWDANVVNTKEKVAIPPQILPYSPSWHSFFYDYDNTNEIWLGIDYYFDALKTTKIYKVDNYLNVLDSIMPDTLIGLWNSHFKLHNKIYSIPEFSHFVVTDSNINLGYDKSDSVVFNCQDLNGNVLISRKILSCDTVGIKGKKFYLTNENNIFVYVNVTANYKSYDLLFVLDTLGNTISYNQIQLQSYVYSTIFRKYNGEFEYIISDYSSIKAYPLDSYTLNITDTIEYPYMDFISPLAINDSIAITKGDTAISYIDDGLEHNKVCIFDYKNHIVTSVIDDTVSSVSNTFLAFHNPDSIYMCYFDQLGSGIDMNFHGYVYIVNFGIDGLINYKYQVQYYSSDSCSYTVSEIKATDDGGVIIAMVAMYDFIEGQYLHQVGHCVFLKFDPNGRVSLEGVQGDKPMLVSYPNPAKDNINFSCSAVIEELEIFNLLGQKVYASKVKDKFIAVDVSNYVSGNYVAKIHTDKGIITKKFVVE